jgi:hypothetical protein
MSAGKGSKQRPTNKETFDESYDRIFKKEKPMITKQLNDYRLVKATDGIVWVSIQPLMTDINKSLVLLMDIPLENLKEEDLQHLDFKIIGMKAIHSFLGALLTEQQLIELRGEHNVH